MASDAPPYTIITEQEVFGSLAPDHAGTDGIPKVCKLQTKSQCVVRKEKRIEPLFVCFNCNENVVHASCYSNLCLNSKNEIFKDPESEDEVLVTCGLKYMNALKKAKKPADPVATLENATAARRKRWDADGPDSSTSSIAIVIDWLADQEMCALAAFVL